MAVATSLQPWITPRYWDSLDPTTPLENGKMYYYAAGTLDLKDIFTDPAGTVPHPNPITLDAAGRSPGMVWFKNGAYDVVIKDKFDVQHWNADGVSGAGSINLIRVDTRAEIRLVEVEGNENALIVCPGDITSGGSENRIYFYDATSSAADNDDTVLQPSTAPALGRWITFAESESTITAILARLDVLESKVADLEGGTENVDSMSTESLLTRTGRLDNLITTQSYYSLSNFGGASWKKTGSTGTPGDTDFENGILYDGNGSERSIQNTKVTPGMYGALASPFTDASAEIQHAFNSSDITLFDRMYYTSNTLTLPQNPAGKTIEGVNSKTSGITTMTNFSGTEKSISSINGGPAEQTINATAHGLTGGEQVFIYGCNTPEYNGFWDNIAYVDDDTFKIGRKLDFPTFPTSNPSGTIFFRTCKPVLTASENYNYEKLTLKNFAIKGDGSLSSACGNAIEFKFNAGMPNGVNSLIKTKLSNLNLNAYGGAGLSLVNSFACDIERVYASSVLHHGILIDDNSATTTFRNYGVSNAGRGKAAVYAKKDISSDGLNVVNDANGASYAIYAGNIYEGDGVGAYTPTVKIRNSNLDGFFLDHIIFSYVPRGTLENNIFHLRDANTDFFVKCDSASNSHPNYNQPHSGLTINANKYNKNGFSLARDYYDSGAGAFTNEDDHGIFFVISDPDVNYYIKNFSLKIPFTLMQTSYVELYRAYDNETGDTIDVLGKSFIDINGGTVKKLMTGGKDGDRVRLSTDSSNMTLKHRDGGNDSFSMTSLNDIKMNEKTVYEFERVLSVWRQIDKNEGDIETKLMGPLETLEITGPIPEDKAVYDILLYSVLDDAPNIQNGGKLLIAMQLVVDDSFNKDLYLISNNIPSISSTDVQLLIGLDGNSKDVVKVITDTGVSFDFVKRIQRA
jgi:hypothetical protein